MSPLRASMAAGLMALCASVSAQTGPSKTYIVQLADAPVATYKGSIQGLPATAVPAGSRLNTARLNARVYMAYLEGRRQQALAGLSGVQITQRYNVVFNGFAARMTEAQAKALKQSNRVLMVTESQRRKLDTTYTPAFLGLTQPGGLWSQLDAAARTVKGEDVIIGVIDSGVWPENASFGDKVDGAGQPVAYFQAGTPVYGPLPASKWRGSCQAGEGFTAAMCNNKLIGARFYNEEFLSSGRPTNLEFASPRDGNGHGSHTASTAGGNANATAAIDGVSVGNMSGIAPRARLAAYKVCWDDGDPDTGDCYDGAILQAIDDAVSDGVDVINYSISGTETNFADPIEIAFLNAAAAGVFVAASAGNDGPGNTVAHISPWLTTVAASSHDRFTVANVTLGSGATFSGPSYQLSGLSQRGLVLSTDAGVTPYANLSAADKTALERCYNAADRAANGASGAAALDPGKVAGKVVVCMRGGNVLVNKADAVKIATGTGLIIQNTPSSANTVFNLPYVVPGVHLTNASYDTMVAYASAPGATVAFGPGVQQDNVVAPVVADFSSRGPNKANANILKPDLTAPGVDIIAAYIAHGLTVEQRAQMLLGNFTPPANANSIQGTSMSSPHVAGAAALLRQRWPAWSPAAIKSALMTSTTGVKLASGAADTSAWNFGAGHLNPNGAAAPSLVYDLRPEDYGRFLCGLNRVPPAGIGSCGQLGTVAAHNLNLASLTASEVPGTLTLQRSVTNVGPATKTFVSTAALPGGWNVSVSPASLTLAPGATGDFSVTLTRTGAPLNTWSFGSLTWSDGVVAVRSPLTARAIGFGAPADVSDVRAAGRGTKVFSVTSAYTGSLSAAASGLVPAQRTAGSVLTNAQQCFDFNVTPGTKVARFQLFNTETLGGAATDLDLEVFNGPGGTGTSVGLSGTGTSNEIVTLVAPAAGTYSACVQGFSTPSGGATFTLSSWQVDGSAPTANMRVGVPSQVYAGSRASIALGWAVPTGARYLGDLEYFDNTSARIGRTTVYVDNH